MIYWYDTEFIEDGRTIELISIGIVAGDGREYYAVNSDAPWDRIKDNDWLVRNVLPSLSMTNTIGLQRYCESDPNTHPRPSISLVTINRLNSSVKPHWVIANEVRDFLTVEPGWRNNELWAYYGAYDHVALCQLWGPMRSLPYGIPMWTNDLMQLWQAAGEPEMPAKSPGIHNALADARWNQKLWQLCQAGFTIKDLQGRSVDGSRSDHPVSDQ
jgi:hypothetical protein